MNDTPDAMRAALWRAVAKTLIEVDYQEGKRALDVAELADAILEPDLRKRIDMMIVILERLKKAST